MLSSIRKFTKSKAFQGLLMVLVVSFAIWGIGDIFRSGRQVEVARVGDVAISDTAFSQRFREEMGRLRSMFGGKLDLSQAIAIGVPDRVLDGMVQSTLFDVEAADLKLTAGTGEVVQWIRRNPNFQNSLGKFDRTLFERTLRANGMSEEDFIALLAHDFRRQQLSDAISGGAVAPEALTTFLYDYREEQRLADVIPVRASTIGDIPQPDETTLRAFHQEHSDKFMAPEYRSLVAVVLRPEDIAAEIAISDEDLHNEFEARRGEFQTPERRTIEQIVVDSEQKRDQAMNLLHEGRAFDAVAKAVTGSGPIELGTVTRDGLPFPALADAAFALDQDQVSEPVKTDFGWHILHVTAIQPAHEATFEEVRKKLRDDLALDRATDDLVTLGNGLEDELAGGASLEDAAQALNLKTLKIDAIDRGGHDPSGAVVPGLPEDSGFLEAVFTAEVGQTSPLTDTSNGGYYMMRVDGITPAALRPFEQVRDQVAAAWRAAQQQKEAEERAQKIADQVKGGGSITDVASENGLSVTRTEPLTRDAQAAVSGGSSGLTDKLFAMRVGDVTTATAKDGAVVAQLAEIRPATADTAPQVSEQIAGALSHDYDRAVLDAFTASLRQEHGVTINRDVMNRLVGEGS
jgi:peptidyl-prolyl cis-trans isomerase D